MKPELLVFCFQCEYEAEEVHTALLKLRKDHLIELEDAIAARRDSAGKLKLRVIHDFLKTGIAGDWREKFLKIIAGKLLVASVFEYVVGEGGYGIPNKELEKIGITRDFLRELNEAILPGTSALFILVKDYPEKIREELRPYKGKMLQTYLTQDETVIKTVLKEAPARGMI